MTKAGGKTLATAAMSLCSGLLIAFLFYKMAPNHEPWTFIVNVPQTPVRGPPDLQTETLTAPHEKQFVHGASLVATPTGLLAFWYRGIYEGANDAQLVSSTYDGSHWSPPTVVTNSDDVGRDIGLKIKSLANPVPFRRSADEIWLFFSASRLSGWATSEILLKRSQDNGRTWGPAKRLYASPFSNMSHMTKSVPVLLSDGRIAFPAYQEMGQNFPVMLVLDENGRVVDRRRMGDGGEVGYQPSIVVTGPTTAVALIRPLRSNPLKKILVSRTNDGGKTWSVATPTNLPNPGGALSAIRYDSTRMLLAFNDDPDSEHDISLAISDLAGTTWRNLGALVRVNKSDNDLVMYPYLIESQPGQFDVIYSRAVKSINHIRVSSTWVQNQLQTIAAQN